MVTKTLDKTNTVKENGKTPFSPKLDNYYTADFETSSYETYLKEGKAWVYAWGLCNIDNPTNFKYGNSIDQFMKLCGSQKKMDGAQIFFHNLRFDGQFIFSYLFSNGFTHAKNEEEKDSKTFTTLIGDQGVFYSIEIIFKKYVRSNGKIRYQKVTIYDSKNKLNFTVKKIAKDFDLKDEDGNPLRKLDENYDHDKYRPIGYVMDEKTELKYLQNDVEIMARALKMVFKQGQMKMTVGSDSLYAFKNSIGGEKKFREWFPLINLNINGKIRKAYKGGFTYLEPEYKDVDIEEDGCTFDNNSIYPAVMLYEKLPYGDAVEFDGEYEYDSEHPLYIQCLVVTFKLKEGFTPTIQLKYSPHFMPTTYVRQCDEPEEIVLSSVDLEVFEKHYEVEVHAWKGGFKFKALPQELDEQMNPCNTIFKKFIDEFREIKENSEGAERTLAKLQLNSLSGKMATNTDSTVRIPYIDEELPPEKQVVKYKYSEEVYRIYAVDIEVEEREEYIEGRFEADKRLSELTLAYPEIEFEMDKVTGDRDPVYTPLGVFITAYARQITIEAIQANKARFIYADTDSIHLRGTEKPKNIQIHPTQFGAWKHEKDFSRARFLKAKEYIEDTYMKIIIDKEGKEKFAPCKKKESSHIKLEVICAGLPDKGKTEVTWENFHPYEEGMDKGIYGGKFEPLYVPGGVVLRPILFTIDE